MWPARLAVLLLCVGMASVHTAGVWRAFAQEKQSASAILGASSGQTNATQKPSAFRQILSGTQAPPPSPVTGAKADEAAAGGPIRLFNTVEFKGPIKSLPQWTRVMQEMNKSGGTLAKALPRSGQEGGKGDARAAWERFAASVAGEEPMEKIRRTNAHFNQYPYRLDEEVWGQADYWAAPAEFVSRSGDCEDFSIIKYYALKELGIDPQHMRIVAVKDRIRGIGHAVLVVFMQDNAWVLDNQTDLVLGHDRYGHYLPQYSVNESYRWAHVPAQ